MISIIAASDLHFGHRNTPARHIAKAWWAWVQDHLIDIRTSDMLILAGDIFDRAMSYPSGEIGVVLTWMDDLMSFCVEEGLILRVLEGTFSHDRKQSRHFQHLLDKHPKLDYKYIDTLSIEHHPKLDIDILYLPDEWTNSCATTQAEIQDLLIKSNLKQVDIVVMHGMFRYQIPQVPGLDFHDDTFFNKIARYFIIVGHIHHPIYMGKIIPPGSFDRLQHGEEEEKGAVHLSFGKDIGSQARFLPNRLSSTYMDIKLNGDPEHDIELIRSSVEDLTDGSHVRLVGKKDNVHMSSLRLFREKYPTLRFSKKDTDNKIVQKQEKIKLLSYSTKPITSQNFMSVYKSYLVKMKYDKAMIKRLLNRIKEVS